MMAPNTAEKLKEQKFNTIKVRRKRRAHTGCGNT
jgi:hypothetical protein